MCNCNGNNSALENAIQEAEALSRTLNQAEDELEALEGFLEDAVIESRPRRRNCCCGCCCGCCS